MIRRLFLLASILLLAACQSVEIDRDYDRTRDFGAYRSWAWKEPALQYRPDDPRLKSDLTEQRLRDALTQQLDQRGLRPAAPGARADLLVQSWLIVDDRQQQVSTNYGGYWGGSWGNYWGGPGLTETRTYDYQVGTLQVDLYDSKDGKLVWRGSAAQILPATPPSPAEREAAIRDTIGRILDHYPPR